MQRNLLSTTVEIKQVQNKLHTRNWRMLHAPDRHCVCTRHVENRKSDSDTVSRCLFPWRRMILPNNPNFIPIRFELTEFYVFFEQEKNNKEKNFSKMSRIWDQFLIQKHSAMLISCMFRAYSINWRPMMGMYTAEHDLLLGSLAVLRPHAKTKKNLSSPSSSPCSVS